MMQKNNKGFSHIETFVVMLVIVLISLVGFSVYKRSSNGANKEFMKSADAQGCPVAAETSIKLAEFYAKNKATFLKDYGSKYFWVWKLGASPENAPYAKNAKAWDKADMTTLNRTESFTYRHATFKFDCALEKKCGNATTSDWADSGKISWCIGNERIKAQPASFKGMKTVYNDGKGMKVKACRVSSNPNKQIRFGVFDTYAEAKKIVENYEKSKGISFKANSAPDGFTAERWKRITVYDRGGTDKERAIADVQKRLYDITYKGDGDSLYDTRPTQAYIKMNGGTKRKYYGGTTDSASLQQIRTAESTMWMWGVNLRTPLNGATETIFHYNKIEGYHKKANHGETNPLVQFKVTYWRTAPKMDHYTDWMGTHPNISSETTGSTKKVFKAQARFNSLAMCSKTMYPTSLYELAKKEGWDT